MIVKNIWRNLLKMNSRVEFIRFACRPFLNPTSDFPGALARKHAPQDIIIHIVEPMLPQDAELWLITLPISHQIRIMFPNSESYRVRERTHASQGSPGHFPDS